ncbi:MAG: glycosyltransferase family 1 protein [Candidatus Woesearchaeota archaeon]|jgi:glycosyltransferase involved in cell wall biosynthesis
MKIAIDLSQIIYGTGVSHYGINLVRNLLKIDSENEYVLYAGSLRRKQDILNFFPQTKVFPIPPRLAHFVWNKLHILPIEKLIGQVDVIHTSDWAEPPSSINKITTIHDLVALKFSKITPKIIVETQKLRLKWVLKESKMIIVPSIATKNDLLELGFREKNIRVIYEAPNLKKATTDEVLEVKKKYSIREDYLIAIGVNPRKNIKAIIDAYHLSKFGKNLKLIIAGEKINTKLEDERGVRFLGYVPDADLGALLTGSKALIFPSLYEGLGIPVLDAFNCEVPVVTSNISSMPEVAGGAAVLVDPYDINSIAAGIEEAISKPKTLIAKGLKHVSNFSWTKTAEETLKVYKEANEV